MQILLYKAAFFNYNNERCKKDKTARKPSKESRGEVKARRQERGRYHFFEAKRRSRALKRIRVSRCGGEFRW